MAIGCGSPSCSRCGHTDVRRSRGSGLLDRLPGRYGKLPYRCRACRLRFYVKPEVPAVASNPAAPSSRSSHRSTTLSRQFKQWRKKKGRKLLIQALVFGGMLALFLICLHYLAQRQPNTESQVPSVLSLGLPA